MLEGSGGMNKENAEELFRPLDLSLWQYHSGHMTIHLSKTIGLTEQRVKLIADKLTTKKVIQKGIQTVARESKCITNVCNKLTDGLVQI